MSPKSPPFALFNDLVEWSLSLTNWKVWSKTWEVKVTISFSNEPMIWIWMTSSFNRIKGDALTLLHTKFLGRVISQRENIDSPSSSFDLTPLDFFHRAIWRKVFKSTNQLQFQSYKIYGYMRMNFGRYRQGNGNTLTGSSWAFDRHHIWCVTILLPYIFILM